MHKPDGIFGVFEVVKDFYEQSNDVADNFFS